MEGGRLLVNRLLSDVLLNILRFLHFLNRVGFSVEMPLRRLLLYLIGLDVNLRHLPNLTSCVNAFDLGEHGRLPLIHMEIAHVKVLG